MRALAPDTKIVILQDAAQVDAVVKASTPIGSDPDEPLDYCLADGVIGDTEFKNLMVFADERAAEDFRQARAQVSPGKHKPTVGYTV